VTKYSISGTLTNFISFPGNGPPLLLESKSYIDAHVEAADDSVCPYP